MKFVNVVVNWNQSTLIFYIAVILCSYFSAILFRKVSLKGVIFSRKKSKFPLWLLITGLILLFVKCFNTSGRDIRSGYYQNFLSATSFVNYRDNTVEIGFRLLQILIRHFTDNYAVFLFVVGLITLIPFLYVIDKYKNIIDVPSVFLFYICVYYFSGFSIARISIAGAFSLLFFDALVEKKKLKALLFIMLACAFHITAVILIVRYVFVLFKSLNKKMLVIGAIAVFAVVAISRDSIFALMQGSERYYVYQLSSSSSFGLEQIAYYIPLIVLYIFGRKKHPEITFGKNFDRISISFISVGFAFGMLSYLIPIFGRLYSLFVTQTIISGYYIHNLKIMKSKASYKILMINILVLAYCFIRFGLYISQYYNLDDIMPYTNVFGWVI